MTAEKMAAAAEKFARAIAGDLVMAQGPLRCGPIPAGLRSGDVLISVDHRKWYELRVVPPGGVTHSPEGCESKTFADEPVDPRPLVLSPDPPKCPWYIAWPVQAGAIGMVLLALIGVPFLFIATLALDAVDGIRKCVLN